MKKRRITKIAVSLILTLSMLLSLPLYLCAADSHDYYYDNPEAVYPAEPYTYTDYPSPDGAHTLRVRHNVVNGVTYYDALVLMRNEDNGILRTFDLHRIHNFKYGFDGYGVHWSPRGNYIIVDHPNPEHGRAVLVIDVQNREYWMPPSTVDNYNSIRAKDKTIPPRDDSTYFGVWKFEEWELDTRATLVA